MTYEDAVRLLARQMDLCERLEAGTSPWTFEHQGRARSEGRFATQAVCALTGRSYAEVRADVARAMDDGRRRMGADAPEGFMECWDRLGR